MSMATIPTLEELFDTSDATGPGHYGPSQTAFLLLDFHSMFVEKVSGDEGPAALKVAATMRSWAKSQGIQVIHCLVDVDSTPFPTCKDNKRFASVVEPLRGSEGKEPPSLLEDGEGDVTFKRRAGHVSALKSPGLEELLKEKGIKSLVLAGLSTSGCVLRTALSATDAEFVVTVLSDGCADSAKDVQSVILGKLLTNRGYVTTAEEFRRGFTKATGGE